METRQAISRGLIFANSQLDGIAFIDMGLLLSKAIEPLIDSKYLSLETNDIVDKMMMQNISQHPVFGNYVAICNIGILFEPVLKLDINAKLRKWAKDFALIINNGEGVIENNTFHLAGTNKPSYSVNLYDIPYNIIPYEI